MNYAKFLYKLNNKIQRLFKRQPLRALAVMTGILTETARVQTLIIASQIYFDGERAGISINHETGETKEIIIKKNEKTKEEFEAEKAVQIANVWINYVTSLCNLWGGNIKMTDAKGMMIQQLLIVLNKIKDGKK